MNVMFLPMFISEQLSNFVVRLLDMCRGEEELDIILNKKRVFLKGGKEGAELGRFICLTRWGIILVQYISDGFL